MDWLVQIQHRIDAAAAMSMLPLALWIVVSGLDDLFILAVWLIGLARQRRREWETPARPGPERRIAIFLPLWHEDAVIAGMLEHNLAAIRYRHYDFFVGAYPNDEPTQAAVRGVAARFDNVHLCACPHDGPTSKADCLNWIYQHMLLREEKTGARFDIVMTHDAEDLIHPDELILVNRLIGRYEMVQTPVLPLETPWHEFTHGLYCDDFAETHTKDLAARQMLGGFIPSCGVGTAYSRGALERLAQSDANRIFEPVCLTEDYENGMRLQLLGQPQLFVPVTLGRGQPLATREYFPRRFRAALKQRTRWVTGISLQTWERHGWGRDWKQWYWLWRDRKGLLGNPLSLYANLLFFYGLATYAAAQWSGSAWGMGAAFATPGSAPLMWLTTFLMLAQLTARAACTGRVYGAWFALWTPARTLVGNVLNSLATVNALYRFANARLRGLPLVWVKTEHSYPSLAALTAHKRPLGEILVGAGYVTEAKLAFALASKPVGTMLGDHLLRLNLVDEGSLVEALSLQSGLTAERVDPRWVAPRVARSLPSKVQRDWRVIAVRVEEGCLHLASPEVPDEGVQEELSRHTRLTLRFVLVTPSNYRQLCEQFL